MKRLDLHIRAATFEDLGAIHDLVRELAIYEKAEAAFTASLQDYERDFKAGIFEAIVAEQGEGIIGMALYYMTYSTWKGRMLYLEDFVVKQAARRQGVGQLLFNRFLEIAHEKDCRMAKWQVLDWNQPAIDFYEKNDATIESGWYNGKLYF